MNETDQATQTAQKPVTRHKVSGDELEAKLSAWAQSQREKRSERTVEDKRRSTRGRVTLALGVLVLAVVVFSSVTNEQLSATEAENAQQVSELQDQLTELESKPDDVDTAALLSELTSAAAADGGAVAKAQQQYVELTHRVSVEPMPGNGAPSDAMLATVEQRKVLAPYFSEGSYVVEDDEEAYRWMSLKPFDENTEIDPRFEWYIRYDGQQASDPSVYTWSLETVMPDMDGPNATASTDRAQVIWICRETEGGTVLAWASAIYNYEDGAGTFDELEVVVTTAGSAHTLGVTNGEE